MENVALLSGGHYRELRRAVDSLSLVVEKRAIKSGWMEGRIQISKTVLRNP